jgi:hypothetical protein
MLDEFVKVAGLERQRQLMNSWEVTSGGERGVAGV